MTAFLLFVLLSAGNCKLWTEFANRVHANPWRCETLRRMRWIHDIGLVAGCGLVGVLTLRTGGLSAGPAWLVGPLVALWSLGYLKLVADAGRYVFAELPHGTRQHSTTLVDAASELGETPTGDGPVRVLAAVPGNDSFTFEVTRKSFAHPDYTASAPLRILHLTDWHFSGTPDRRFYERATAACLEESYDVAVFTGDLVDRLSLLEWLPTTLGRITAPLGRYYILGNHDWMAGHEPVRDAMNAAGWSDVSPAACGFNHAGVRFQLSGDERPWMPFTPSADTDGFHIALCHTPDRFYDAQSRGARVVLAGHNHGGQVVLPVLGPVYSPSRYGVRFAAGCFRDQQTFMHVGRGLGGIHPLRINCRPEVTVLTLTSPQLQVQSAQR